MSTDDNKDSSPPTKHIAIGWELYKRRFVPPNAMPELVTLLQHAWMNSGAALFFYIVLCMDAREMSDGCFNDLMTGLLEEAEEILGHIPTAAGLATIHGIDLETNKPKKDLN